MPFHCTTEFGAKLEPKTAKTMSVRPAKAEGGLMLVSVGKLALTWAMVKVCAKEVPTPGVKTVTDAVPAWARRVAGTNAVNWVLLTNVVAKLVPFHCTVEPSTKLTPFTVSVKPLLPAWTEFGLRPVMNGMLVGKSVAVKVTALEVRGLPLTTWLTVTEAVAGLATSEERTTASRNTVPLTLSYVVGNDVVVPFAVHCTVAPGTKLEPFTNSVKLALPAWTELGLRLVITGAIRRERRDGKG